MSLPVLLGEGGAEPWLLKLVPDGICSFKLLPMLRLVLLEFSDYKAMYFHQSDCLKKTKIQAMHI